MKFGGRDEKFNVNIVISWLCDILLKWILVGDIGKAENYGEGSYLNSADEIKQYSGISNKIEDSINLSANMIFSYNRGIYTTMCNGG